MLVWLGEKRRKIKTDIKDKQVRITVHRDRLQTQEQLLNSWQLPNEKISYLAARSPGHSKGGDNLKMKF